MIQKSVSLKKLKTTGCTLPETAKTTVGNRHFLGRKMLSNGPIHIRLCEETQNLLKNLGD